MAQEQTKKKKRRPATRGFWAVLRRLPEVLRRPLIRSQFSIEYDLPSEITLKVAESLSEIQEALKIVHDSYVELGYIQPQSHGFRFTQHLANPTTVILIAKWQDEVIGTISIVPDGPMGLPVETTWDISRYRKSGYLLAEASALAIKPTFKLRRGKLLLPLCKLLYEYATSVLHLDGLVMATTVEVEAFYTDLMLFDRILHTEMGSAAPHSVANNNPSVCCILDFKNIESKYIEIYSQKPLEKNLYFFFKFYRMPNIASFKNTSSLHLQLKEKIKAVSALIQTDPRVLEGFSEKEIEVLTNLGIFDDEVTKKHSRFRVHLRTKTVVFSQAKLEPRPALLLNVSRRGVQIKLDSCVDESLFEQGKIAFPVVEKNQLYLIHAKVRWSKERCWLGCEIEERSLHIWDTFHSGLLAVDNLEQTQFEKLTPLRTKLG